MMSFTTIRSQFQGLSLDNVGTWPVFPRLAAWLGVVLACCVLGYVFVWQSQISQLQELFRAEDTLKTLYRSKLQQSINLDDLRHQKEQINQFVLSLEKQLPSKAEMDALLSDINQAGIGRGLQFELFRPGAVVLRDYYAELPITVRVSGRFHDLGEFASDIANLPRIVTLNNLNIQTSKDAGVLSLDATAKTFRYFDDEEIAEQRKAREAAKAGKKK
jgi:type IV pilus assembly protein PilO